MIVIIGGIAILICIGIALFLSYPGIYLRKLRKKLSSLQKSVAETVQSAEEIDATIAGDKLLRQGFGSEKIGNQSVGTILKKAHLFAVTNYLESITELERLSQKLPTCCWPRKYEIELRNIRKEVRKLSMQLTGQ